MKRKPDLNRIAQWAIVLAAVLGLKLYYSNASANELVWILAPTASLVQWLSGVAFEFESHAGYISSDRSFLIAPSCAGVNFLITAFLTLSLARLLKAGSRPPRWSFFLAVAGIAYVVTLAANTVRIAIALEAGQPSIGWLSPAQLHRVEGIIVYFGFLLILFVGSENLSSAPGQRLWRSFLPLIAYYATVLGIPIVNGGFRISSGFMDHAVVVLLIPLTLIVPVIAFRIYRQKGLKLNLKRTVSL